eukprot:EST47620.1 Hypothetical protein SS50377_12315 [Spironucleus salmonicida]
MGQKVKKTTARDKNFKIHNVYEHKFKANFNDAKAFETKEIPEALSRQTRIIKRSKMGAAYIDDLQQKLGKNLKAEQYALSKENHLQFTLKQIQRLLNDQQLRENPDEINCTDFILKGQAGNVQLTEFEFQSSNYLAEIRAAELRKRFQNE